MMRAQFFDISLTVRAPVLCAGLERKAWGWDVSFIRNEESEPVIPAITSKPCAPGDGIAGGAHDGSR